MKTDKEYAKDSIKAYLEKHLSFVGNIFVKRKFLILASVIVILTVLVAGRSFIGKINTLTNDESKAKTTSVKNDLLLKVECTRKTRLDNLPQYDRALSLVQQRVDENNKYWSNDETFKDQIFKYFPPDLVNCIKISEEDINKSTGLEGYFTFNSKDIKTDYYPITVSSNYRSTDDIVTTLLLSHEMTHVQQYIDVLNGKAALSCIDREIEAFIAQLKFYVMLSNEEHSSVYYRIQNDENLHSQLKILDAMLTINRDSNCKFDGDCMDVNLRNKLRVMITNDSYYKKQCKL